MTIFGFCIDIHSEFVCSIYLLFIYLCTFFNYRFLQPVFHNFHNLKMEYQFKMYSNLKVTKLRI